MSNKKDLTEEMISLKNFKTLVRVYEEIASMRMKKTRDTVVKNRKYLDEIEDIFEKVRISYAREVKKLIQKGGSRAKDNITFLAHNGKNVAVFISANSGLYGHIIQSTFEKFMEEVKNSDSEVTIVGKHGVDLFLMEEPDRPYTFFDIPDKKLESKDLDNLIRHIVQYEEMHIYHGKFVSVVSQVPSLTTVSAGISLEDDKSQGEVSFIFEPSLKKILMFFETQIFGARFEQTVRESQLAKYASRVMAMDQADTNIDKRIKKLMFELLKNSHRTKNRKQIDMLSSASMW